MLNPSFLSLTSPLLLTPRPSLHLLLAPQPPQYLLATRLEPTPQGLGVKVAKAPSGGSGGGGEGCVVKEIADFCSTTQLRPGDW